MSEFSGTTWLALAAITALTMIACGHVLASLLRDHHQVVNLKREVNRLREEYNRRMSEMAAMNAGEHGGHGEVEIVEDEPTQRAA